MFLSIALLSAGGLLSTAEPQWPPRVEVLERDLPQGAQFAAAYAATAEPGFSVTFFSITGSDGALRWHAVRHMADQNLTWASGSDCPALYATLDWLSDLRPPAIAVNGLRRLPPDVRPYEMRPRRGPVADGPTYWLAGSGWGPDQSSVHLTMMSTGGYVADWGEATTRHMADCWKTERPF